MKLATDILNHYYTDYDTHNIKSTHVPLERVNLSHYKIVESIKTLYVHDNAYRQELIEAVNKIFQSLNTTKSI